MNLSVSLDVDVRCTSCDAERPFPDHAERVLEGEVLYADVAEPCACGATRIRVAVKFDGEQAKDPDGGQAPSSDARGRAPRLGST